MSKLLMLAGGSSGIFYPVVLDESLYADETIDATDLIGTDGAALVIVASTTCDNPADNTVYIDGDFSAVSSLINVNTTGKIYAYLAGMTTYTAGYYPIISIDGTDGMVIGDTSIAGDAIESDDSISAVFVGGSAGDQSGSVFETVDDRIGADIVLTDWDGIDVRFNTDITFTATITLVTDGGLGAPIVLIGCDSNFDDVSAVGDYIEVTGNEYYYFNSSGEDVEMRHFYVTSNYTGWGFVQGDENNILRECYIKNVNTGIHCGALNAARGLVINCILEKTNTSDDYPVVSMTRGILDSCLIITSNGYGAQIIYGYSCNTVINCIFYNKNGSSGSIAILIDSADTVAGAMYIKNCSFLDFDYSIYGDADAGVVSDYTIFIMNCIIWGSNEAGSYGIYNSAATKCHLTSLNNAIGNVANTSNIEYYEYDTIALTANPFLNANTDYSEPSDFYLNDTAGGGALCKNTAYPIKFGLGSTQDNFKHLGAITAEATGGGGGRIMRERRHNV